MQIGIRKTVTLLVSFVLLGGMGYCSYNYLSAEDRIRAVCAKIQPGMKFAQLHAFAEQHGLKKPRSETGPNFLVEAKTFGRYGCTVVMEAGAVKSVEYSFAD
jgi:hypothetical protein